MEVGNEAGFGLGWKKLAFLQWVRRDPAHLCLHCLLLARRLPGVPKQRGGLLCVPTDVCLENSSAFISLIGDS